MCYFLSLVWSTNCRHPHPVLQYFEEETRFEYQLNPAGVSEAEQVAVHVLDAALHTAVGVRAYQPTRTVTLVPKVRKVEKVKIEIPQEKAVCDVSPQVLLDGQGADATARPRYV